MSTATDLSLHGTRSFEPPYDDEPGASTAMTDGSLALALPLPTSAATVPALRLLTGGRSEPSAEPAPQPRRKPVAKTTAKSDVRPTALPEAPPARSDSPLPPARAYGARLVQVLSEACAGQRPLTHLAPYLSGVVYDRLERHFASTLRGTGASGTGNRASVRSVRVFEPGRGVAEVSAVVRRGERMAAIALRLEGVNGRWQCTALQIG